MRVILNSAWASKINWTQVLGVLAMIATALGKTVPPDLIPATVAWIGAGQAVLTIVLRTWFTGKPV